MPLCVTRPHNHNVAVHARRSRILTRFSFDPLPLLSDTGSLCAVLPAAETLLLRCSAFHLSLCYYRQDLLRYVLHAALPPRFCTHSVPPYQ